ncbi:radical SAM protein [bacterium]|nr:radical SAM protein [bacterium]
MYLNFPSNPNLPLSASVLIAKHPDTEIKSFQLSRLARAQGLKHPREGTAWIVNKALGTWKTVSVREKALFALLSRPRTLDGLLSALNPSDPQYAANLLDVAYNMGFISVGGKMHPRYASGPEPPLGSHFLALHMTSDCNLRCAYCYNSSGQNSKKFLQTETALYFIKRACAELPAPVLNIDFLGGEPLLALDTVKEILRKAPPLASQYGKKINFLLQTNGMLLSEETARLLREHGVGVGVSIDGPARWHDRYRRNSQGSSFHGLICSNFLKAQELGLKVSPLAVIYAPEQLEEAFDFFIEELRCESMRFNFFCPLGRGRELKESLCPPSAYREPYLKVIFKALQRFRSCGRPLNIYDLQFRLKSLAEFRQDYMCLRSPCGIGTSILSLDPEGGVYACEEYEQSCKSALFLGNAQELPPLAELPVKNENLKHLLSRNVENISKCRRCWLKRHCGGGCAQRALAQNGGLNFPEAMCGLYKELYPDLMWLLGAEEDLLQALALQNPDPKHNLSAEADLP